MDVGSLVAYLELNVDQFRRDLNQAESNFRQLGREAERANDQIRQSANRVGDGYRSAGQDAERAADGTTTAWRQAGTRAETSADGVGTAYRQAGGEAERAAGGVGSAWQRTAREAETSMQGAAGSAEGAGASGGVGFVAGFAGKLKGLAGKGGPIATALVGVAAIGMVAGGKLAEAVVEGFGMQADADVVQAKLAIDDATMARVGQAAGAAYVNNFGESVAANRGAIVAGFDLGLINADSATDDMQNLIEKTDTLNTLLDSETTESLGAVAGLVKSGLVANVNEAFDLIAAGRTKGMNAQGDLLESITEYSVGWKQTGLSAETTMALIKQSMDMGVDNTDRAADALREFGRRVVEEGDTLTETFNQLGFDGADMLAKFQQGGPPAEKAFDDLFDAIRKIENPAERAAAAQKLLGDTSGDFIKALAQWDPSKAVQDFGSVEDAAKKAGDTIGDNAASKIETARRTITVAADEIKLKLAEAFAPMAGDAAVWVTDNQEEILIFFAELAKVAVTGTAAVFDGAGAMLQFGSVAYGAGLQILDGFVGPLLTMMESLGGMAKHIPGLGWLGNAMEDTATKTRGIVDGMKTGADKMGDMGGAMFTLADKLRDGTATIDDFIAAQQAAAGDTDITTAAVAHLSGQLNELPRDKAIDITTPGGAATRDLLTELGVKVNTDNHKNLVVESPLAPAVLQILRELGIEVERKDDKDILVTSNAPGVKVDIDNLNTAINNVTSVKDIEFRALLTGAGASTTPPASGTNVMPPIPGMPRAHGGPISGPGGPKGDKILTPTSDGEWVIQAPAVDFYGEQFFADLNAMRLGVPRADGGPVGPAAVRSAISGLDGASYAFGGWDGTWNTDCSGAQAKAANWATTGDTEAGGRFATGNMAEALAARGYMAGQAPAGVPAIEHGWYNDSSSYGGHAAGLIQDPMGGDTPFEMGGNSGGGAVGAGASSSRDIGATDYAWLPLASEDPNATGGGSLGTQSQIPGTSTPGVYGINGGEGSAQNVYVVGGRLDGSVSTSSSSATAPSDTTGPEVFGKGPLPIVAFENGGTIPGVGNEDSELILGMPGEEIIRKGPAAEWRPLLKAINSGKLSKFAMGGTVGFGGYSDDTSDAMAPKNWYDWASLAVGGGFAAASMVTPYVNMATSGTIDIGSAMPTVNTSANSIDGVTEAINELRTDVQRQSEELIDAVVRGGKTLHMVDRGTGAADMAGVRIGL